MYGKLVLHKHQFFTAPQSGLNFSLGFSQESCDWWFFSNGLTLIPSPLEREAGLYIFNQLY
jgi:hypothetical protein